MGCPPSSVALYAAADIRTTVDRPTDHSTVAAGTVLLRSVQQDPKPAYDNAYSLVSPLVSRLYAWLHWISSHSCTELVAAGHDVHRLGHRRRRGLGPRCVGCNLPHAGPSAAFKGFAFALGNTRSERAMDETYAALRSAVR